MLVAILATASAASGGFAGVEPTTPSIAIPGTTVSVSPATPTDNAAGVSIAATKVALNRESAVLAAGISTTQAKPTALAIGIAIINETEHGPPVVPEDSPLADQRRAEGYRGGSDPSTAVLAPTLALPADPPSSAVGGALARRWETAGDCLEGLLGTEATEAVDMPRRLASFALGTSLCIALGIHLHNGGMNFRLKDRRREQTKAC
jgi:hypothetical protein